MGIVEAIEDLGFVAEIFFDPRGKPGLAAVRDSRQREIVLRLMAKWSGDDLPLSEIYPLAKKLHVVNTYTSKRDLMLKRHGGVLVTPPMHTKGIILVCLKDMLIYVLLFIMVLKRELTAYGDK